MNLSDPGPGPDGFVDPGRVLYSRQKLAHIHTPSYYPCKDSNRLLHVFLPSYPQDPNRTPPTPLRVIDAPCGAPQALALDPWGSHLAVLAREGLLAVVDPRTGAVLRLPSQHRAG